MRWTITRADGSAFIFDDFGAVGGEKLVKAQLGDGDSYAAGAVDPDPFAGIPAIELIRIKRAGLLAASDWTQLPDSPLSSELRAAWATYRQALRDLPDIADPDNVIWPEQP